MELHPQQLVDWALRLPAFNGVVSARASADQQQPVGGGGVREVDPSLMGLAADPIFNSIIDFGD